MRSPDDFGIMLTIGIAMAVHLSQTAKARWQVWAYRVYLLLGTLAVARTATRTAAVALAVVLVISYANRNLLRPRFLALGVVGIGVAAVGIRFFVSSASLARIGSVASANGTTLNHRTTFWHEAWDLWSQHPLVGGRHGQEHCKCRDGK